MNALMNLPPDTVLVMIAIDNVQLGKVEHRKFEILLSSVTAITPPVPTDDNGIVMIGGYAINVSSGIQNLYAQWKNWNKTKRFNLN